MSIFENLLNSFDLASHGDSWRNMQTLIIFLFYVDSYISILYEFYYELYYVLKVERFMLISYKSSENSHSLLLWRVSVPIFSILWTPFNLRVYHMFIRKKKKFSYVDKKSCYQSWNDVVHSLVKDQLVSFSTNQNSLTFLGPTWIAWKMLKFRRIFFNKWRGILDFYGRSKYEVKRNRNIQLL